MFSVLHSIAEQFCLDCILCCKVKHFHRRCSKWQTHQAVLRLSLKVHFHTAVQAAFSVSLCWNHLGHCMITAWAYVLNAASVLELKFSSHSDSRCFDSIWKDISSEYLLLQSTSISVWLNVLVGSSIWAGYFLQHTVLKGITVWAL